MKVFDDHGQRGTGKAADALSTVDKFNSFEEREDIGSYHKGAL
jgi:hypothetical protein